MCDTYPRLQILGKPYADDMHDVKTLTWHYCATALGHDSSCPGPWLIMHSASGTGWTGHDRALTLHHLFKGSRDHSSDRILAIVHIAQLKCLNLCMIGLKQNARAERQPIPWLQVPAARASKGQMGIRMTARNPPQISTNLSAALMASMLSSPCCNQTNFANYP